MRLLLAIASNRATIAKYCDGTATGVTRPSGVPSRSSDPEYPRPTVVHTASGLDPSPAAQPTTPPTAPAVVAVVVARDPGDWFEETMASLAEQDYPNLERQEHTSELQSLMRNSYAVFCLK